MINRPIKTYCDRQNIKIADLAEALGTSVHQLYLLDGYKSDVKASTLLKIYYTTKENYKEPLYPHELAKGFDEIYADQS